MSLEDYAYLAEILAAVAVVPSLLYLAVQVRQANRQEQATARYAFISAMSDINIAIAQNKEAASVWRRGLQSTDELDDDELMQFWAFMGQYGNSWNVLFQLHEEDLLPESQWVVVRNDIQSVYGSAGGRAFWKIGAAAFDPGFAKFVDLLLAADQQPYDMLERR